jgi:hypothetical protein
MAEVITDMPPLGRPSNFPMASIADGQWWKVTIAEAGARDIHQLRSRASSYATYKKLRMNLRRIDENTAAIRFCKPE